MLTELNLRGVTSLHSFPSSLSCIIPTSVGEFNLTALGVLRFTEPGSNWLYVFSPCTDVDPAPFSGLCGLVTPVPAFQVTMGECLRLGKLKSRNVTALPGPRLGISVEYNHGDGGRLSTLELVCGDGPTVVLGLIAERQPRQYLLEARGQEGCPSGCPRDPHNDAECGGTRQGRCYKDQLGALSCTCITGHGGPYCASILEEHRISYNSMYTAIFVSFSIAVVLLSWVIWQHDCCSARAHLRLLHVTNVQNHLSICLFFCFVVLLVGVFCGADVFPARAIGQGDTRP